MSYFPGYDESVPEAETGGQAEVADPGLDSLPFDHLDDRRFEVLTYRLKKVEHGEDVNRGREQVMAA